MNGCWSGLSLCALNPVTTATQKLQVEKPSKLLLCRLLPRVVGSFARTFVPGITSVNPNATIAMRQISFVIISKFVLLHKKPRFYTIR
jgi:hypothetical protein